MVRDLLRTTGNRKGQPRARNKPKNTSWMDSLRKTNAGKKYDPTYKNENLNIQRMYPSSDYIWS